MRPTSPLGVHALVWVGDTSPTSLAYAVSQTVAAGYDLLELSLHDLDNLDRDHARATVHEAGLQVACSRGLAFDADISSPDPAVVERGVRLLTESLHAAADLGARILTGALYSALGKYDRPVTESGWNNAVSALKSLATEAAPLGVDLGIEVCNRYETNVVNTAEQALNLLEAIDKDNVGVHLDTYHMNIEEDDFVRPVRRVAEHLRYVHIGENHRGFLGSGHLDFTSFFHALSDVDYQGPVTFESFSSSVIAPGLSSDLAVWRDLWDDGMTLAQHAREYLAAHLWPHSEAASA